MRAFLTALFSFIMRVFFRRIEIEGQDKVPTEGPVIFVLNHPNALIDPAFMLCFAPRPTSFIAKSTLFTMPIIGTIVRGFDCLPAYRRVDTGSDPSKNRETFTLARTLLTKGGSIALFPEGTSHSDPQMRRMKTGAARIALGSASLMAEDPTIPPLLIIPVGLFYTRKTTFRSSALLYYGEGFEVTPTTLNEDFEPPREPTLELTEQIRVALNTVTLQAEQSEALQLAAMAEALFAESEGDELSSSFELRRRILDGYHNLSQDHDTRLQTFIQRLRRFHTSCKALDLTPAHLMDTTPALPRVLRRGLQHLLVFLLLGPLGLLGAFLHTLPYLGVDMLAHRYAKGEDDMLSTIKVLAALLLFPLTWLIIALILGFTLSWWAAALSTLLVPLSGYAALHLREELDEASAATRALTVVVARQHKMKVLTEERQALQDEIIALEALVSS